MTWKEIKDKANELGILDDDNILIRFKIESESYCGVTNTTSELCVETFNPDYEIKTIVSITY